MIAKISLTTTCNAKCKTCPVWEKPGSHMNFEDFQLIWDKLMKDQRITKVLINSTGDLFNIPYYKQYLYHIALNHKKYTVLTTNAGKLKPGPMPFDEVIISFNGGTKKAYEYTTGLSFDETVKNIRDCFHILEKINTVEMHCLMWEGNQGTEKDLKKLWKDFPGRVRLSYKYDNQMKEDKTLDEFKTSNRVPCDYLNMLVIMPDGKIISCAHDFDSETDFGNILTENIEDLLEHKNRKKAKKEHSDGEYIGICEKCNYNTPIGNRIQYIK